MTYKSMKFKNKRVFVKVDDSGEVVITNGRATMKYKLEDDRTYQPWPSNLSDWSGEESDTPATPPRSRARSAARVKQSGGGGSDESAIVAYTDGACLGNPGQSGLGLAIDWPDGRQLQRGEPLGRGTNNIAELTAILRVLEIVGQTSAPVVIHTDSEYAIGVLVRNWKAKANRELIAKIKSVLAQFDRLELRKVRGHAGIPQNELVDQLARQAAQLQEQVDQP